MAKSKESFYFSHDCGACRDLKIIKLRRKFGWEGYGVFWAVIEALRETSNYEIALEDVDDLVFEFGFKREIFDFLVECGLLKQEGNFFYSDSLKRRMDMRDSRAKTNRENGRKGGRPKKNDNSGDNFFNQDDDEFIPPSIDSDTAVGIKNTNNRHGDATVTVDADINTRPYDGKTADANTVMQWSQALGICQFSEFEKMAILDLSEKGCIADDAFAARLNSPKYFGKIDNEHTRRLIVTQKDIREKAAKKSQERGWAF